MKKFAAIVSLAALMGTMYGYVLGRLSSLHPSQPPQSPFSLASEYPAFLLQGDFWGHVIYWSALPLFLLFAWLVMSYVQQTYVQNVRARLNQETVEHVGELFKEVASMASGRRDSSRETTG